MGAKFPDLCQSGHTLGAQRQKCAALPLLGWKSAGIVKKEVQKQP